MATGYSLHPLTKLPINAIETNHEPLNTQPIIVNFNLMFWFTTLYFPFQLVMVNCNPIEEKLFKNSVETAILSSKSFDSSSVQFPKT